MLQKVLENAHLANIGSVGLGDVKKWSPTMSVSLATGIKCFYLVSQPIVLKQF